MRFRVRLLGELMIESEDGELLELPTPTQLRLLVALAIRPCQPRPITELSTIVWDKWQPGYGGNLETPVSRLRPLLPIDSKSRSSQSYRTSLPREAIDATYFIDAVAAMRSTDAVDELLGMWRGDPFVIYDFLPEADWRALKRARDALIASLATYSLSERASLQNLETFLSIYPKETGHLSVGVRADRKKILIVDDDCRLTSMLRDLLHDYQCVVANNTADAIDIVSDLSAPLDAALVDLHLSKHLDSSGISVLSALQTVRPEIPRVLLTSSPPADRMTEVLKRYGLFEVLIKDGPNAPLQTRSTVDAMLGSGEGSMRRRAHARFESTTTNAEHQLQAVLVRIRKMERRGELVEPGWKNAVLDELANLFDDARDLREQLNSCPAETMAREIDSFQQRWLHYQPIQRPA